MATEPMVQVGYEGRTYSVPADIVRLNSQQPGVAAQYIEDQIAEETLRVQQSRQRKEQSVDAEFVTIKSKLTKVDQLEEQLNNQAQVIASYKAANEAQAAQIAALEDSTDGLGSTSSKARQATLELSQQVTGAAVMTESLARQRDYLEAQATRMEDRLTLHEDRQSEQLDNARKAAITRQNFEQEATNRLIDDVARAEDVARKAESAAAQALRDAEAARLVTRDDISRGELQALVQAEIRASAEGIAELVIAEMQNQFPQGLGGVQFDAGYLAQTALDRNRSNEIRLGTDEAWKATNGVA